jgi:hypothetical protein
MPISLECHGCGKKLWVKDKFAGARVRCPACRYITDIPDAEDDDEPASVAGEDRQLPPRPRRRRRKKSEPTNQVFDAMANPHEPAVMRALDGVFCLHPLLLFLASVPLMPFAIIVLVVSNDREAVRNAGMTLFFSVIKLLIVAWVLILLKSWDALY